MNERRLFRSKKDRIIAGVCGGLAEYFHVDSLVMRAIFVLLLFSSVFSGAVIIIYLLALVLMPHEDKVTREPGQPDTTPHAATSPRQRGLFVGVILVTVGAFHLLAALTGTLPLLTMAAAGLIVLGILVLNGAFTNGFSANDGRQ